MWKTLKESIAAVWVHRFALQNLVLKDFRIRYRNMSLGVLWSVLNPLILLGILAFVFTHIFKPPDDGCFPVFILLGLTAFNFFSLCVSAATGSIVHSASLIQKVLFPRIIIVIAAVLAQAIHFLIQLVILGVFIVAFSVPVTAMYLWLPVIYIVELAFIVGVSLICATLNVYFRDTRYLVESGVTILFWVSCIFYPLSWVKERVNPLAYKLFLLNPIAGCIDSARRVVLDAAQPDPTRMVAAVVVSLAFLCVGVLVFCRYEANFADNV